MSEYNMRNDIVNSSVAVATSLNGESIKKKQISNSNTAAVSNATNLWKFGSSELRIGQNGEVRGASDEEILAETKNSPAAMVKLLGAGADLLRFDANGEYRDDVHLITLIQSQEGKTPEQMTEEYKTAVENLRAKMRNDIEAGVFRVNDSGQIFHNGEPVPQETIGFELNALLIESLTNKVSELTALSSQISLVNSFVQEQLENHESGEVPILFEQESNFRIDQRNVNRTTGPETSWEESTRKSSHPATQGQPSLTPFDEFIQENSAFSTLLEGVNPLDFGQTLLGTMEENYQKLLEGSGLSVSSWLKPGSDFSEVTGPSIEGGRPPIADLTRENIHSGIFGVGAVDRHFRAVPRLERTSVKTITDSTLLETTENIRTRTSTLSSLSEQLGTNFKVDNARFNNIIEAMNNYNKSVLDSLRRFSII